MPFARPVTGKKGTGFCLEQNTGAFFPGAGLAFVRPGLF